MLTDEPTPELTKLAARAGFGSGHTLSLEDCVKLDVPSDHRDAEFAVFLAALPQHRRQTLAERLYNIVAEKDAADARSKIDITPELAELVRMHRVAAVREFIAARIIQSLMDDETIKLNGKSGEIDFKGAIHHKIIKPTLEECEAAYEYFNAAAEHGQEGRTYLPAAGDCAGDLTARG